MKQLCNYEICYYYVSSVLVFLVVKCASAIKRLMYAKTSTLATLRNFFCLALPLFPWMLPGRYPAKLLIALNLGFQVEIKTRKKNIPWFGTSDAN